MYHRIILMASGLFMMFTVFAGIMWLGAFLQESEAAYKNGLMSIILAAITIGMFVFAMNMRKKAQVVIDSEIKRSFTGFGYILASEFAANLNVSLDDSRDILDGKMQKLGWSRTELPQYDAIYQLK